MSALHQASLRAPGASTETLSGVVQSVRYYNPRNAWAVLGVNPRGGDSECGRIGGQVTVVGAIANPREGDEYEFTGKTMVDPKWGRQFKVETSNVLLPSTRKGIIRYLSSIATGVGEVKAARIVGALGDDCLSRLHADPSILDRLDFLTALQREEIKTHLREHTAVAEVSGLICKEGITPNLAAKIVAVYGEDAVRVVKEEPYKLTEIDGIGFLTADKVAMAVGIPEDAPQRIQAAILHILAEARDGEGHCSLRPNDIVKALPQLLGCNVATSIVAEAVNTLIHAGLLVRDGDDIYLADLYEDEVAVAEMVRKLVAATPPEIANLDGQIEAQQTTMGVVFHPKQREAIRMALSSGFSVMTGSPGSGKTLITRAVVNIHKAERHTRPVYLCSPTGRAAKRLAEATGCEAKTIHRLLGYVPGLGFTVTEEEPLTPGLLIMDEGSMTDLPLMRALLDACSSGMQVVLVGDVDQLPSVGPGSVLRDIISSGAVPVTKLDYIFRQEEGSGISALASRINAGEAPTLEAYGDVVDVTLDTIQTPDDALPLVIHSAKRAYEEYGLLGFTVLAPGHKGTAGVRAINYAVREVLNPGAKGSKFAPGDRCMVIKNCYSHDVFNGDLGIVRTTDDEDGSIEADFGDKWVTFGREEDQAPLDILQLAFCSTIHRSQGGEYPAVIVVLTRQHYRLLARTLIYTAITRAKKHLAIICQPDALKAAVRNNKIAQRNSRLSERLKGVSVDA